MNSASKSPLEALVWIVVPKEKVGTDTLGTWLDEHVREWIEAIKEGVSTQLVIRFVALYKDSFIFDGDVQKAIRAAVSSQFGSIEVSFEKTPCLLIKYPDGSEEPKCDLLSSERCDHVHRLLLIDESGDGYPCYGYWRANQSGDAEYPSLDDAILKAAYRAKEEERFRSLCIECIHTASNGTFDIFPCSRHGCSSQETMWVGELFQHLQFGGGNRDNRCGGFVPVFETSLERSRLRLEKILFKEDFWRSALIDKNYELERYWPMPKGDLGALIPIYGSYRFEIDSATSLDQFPASNYFSQELVDLSSDNYFKIRDAFLPVCFLPHLRVMFELVKDVCLLSVILSDRHRGSEFRYRSLYRNDESAPSCFREDSWQALWRLPYDWSAWKENVLNLSSAVRAKNTQQPTEYLAVLSDTYVPERRLTKRYLNLSVVSKEFESILEERASAFRSALRAGCKTTSDEYNKVLLPLFFMHSNERDNAIGRKAWELVQKSQWSEHLCINDSRGQWVRWSDVRESDKGDSGCRLLNYIVWVRSIFQSDLCAIEAFNPTSIAEKLPSQFVVFSSRPLGTLERARFKLTLTTLLQPIESAYAIGTEIDKHQLKLASTVYAAGHSQKHIFSPMKASLQTLESDEIISANSRLQNVVKKMQLQMSWAEGSSSNMDLIASLSLHDGQLDQLDENFYAPKDCQYFIGEKIRLFVGNLFSAGQVLNINSDGLDKIDKVQITEGIKTGKGLRRLCDSFYDELFQEILFNAKKWSSGTLEISCQDVSNILLETAHDQDSIDDLEANQQAILFRNPAAESALRGRGLQSKYSSLAHAKKGGLCYAAMRLEVTRQGYLLVRREEKGKQSYFSLAVILNNCRRRSDGEP